MRMRRTHARRRDGELPISRRISLNPDKSTNSIILYFTFKKEKKLSAICNLIKIKKNSVVILIGIFKIQISQIN